MDWQKLLSHNRLRDSTRDTLKDPRNEFESDFGRIIFSPATRRMHDKTQVFPLTTDDNIHSRLTHSLEVMSVGYSLAVRVCESKTFQERIGKDQYTLFREIPIIVKSLCVIHDIGNPPFGHFGETIIQTYFKEFFSSTRGEELNLSDAQKNDFCEFDGNAQGLRVLTKLQILNDPFGLNLTFATLGAYIKYPNFRKPVKDGNIEERKSGVFTSEEEYFSKIADNCGLRSDERVIRHPLCYLMEAADSICYLTMDIEDGYNKNLYDLNHLYRKLKDVPSIQEKIERIFKDPEKHYRNDVTKVVNFRIELIKTLVHLAATNFEENIDKIEAGVYNSELIYDDSSQLADTLGKFCTEEIFTFRDINSLEVTGNSVVGGLLDHYINLVFNAEKKFVRRAQALISKSILKAAFAENELDENASLKDLNDYYKLRVIVDFVSGMTDQYALSHYQKLSGQKII